jgi:iron complex outermembrane receptor protein
MIKLMNFLISFERRRIFILVICILPAFSFAQKSFSGKLKDKETGEAIIGATISVDSSFSVAFSDANGHFTLQGKNENMSVTITHLSYLPEKKTLTEAETTIELSPHLYPAEEVNVSATRADNSSMFAYTDVNKQEIQKNNLGQDLPLLLNLTPSVVTTSDAGSGVGYTGIRIRGSDATRVNVTINGIPVNDAESHQVYWVDLPDFASSIENLQIQRGLGNSTNGSGAFGGSINILSSKLDTRPFAQISSSTGSFNTFKNTVSFGTGLLSNAFGIEGRLSKINSDGYIDRATSDLHSFYLTGGYYGNKNSLRAIIFSGKEKTYQAWYGVPEDSLKTNRTYNPVGEYYDSNGNVHYYNNQSDNYQQDYYQLLYSHEFNKSLTANFALHYTHGKGYYEEYRQNDLLANYNLPDIILGGQLLTSMDIIRQRWLSNDFYGATFSFDYTKQKFDFKIGGAFNKYKGKHYDEIIASQFMMLTAYPYRYSENAADKNDGSIFVRALYHADEKLNLSVDLQERMVGYSFEGFDDNYMNNQQKVKLNFFNPKAGVSYQLMNQMQLYFSAGIGHKEPVRDDFVNSTPASRPEAEYMLDYEAGTRLNYDRLSLSFNGYYMDYKSQLILTGKINDVGEYIRESVKNSYRAGIEAEGKVIFNSLIYSSANVTMSKNKIREYKEYIDDYDGGPQVVNIYTNTNISFSPAVTGAVIVGINPLKNFNLEFTGKYVGKQFLDNTSNNSRVLDDYFINDMHLSYSIHTKSVKEITFKFSLNNLLDVVYNSNGYSFSGYSGGSRYDYNYYFPQAKMNWFGGVTVKI